MKKHIKIIGTGEFGEIYKGIKEQDAIDFLFENKSGEVPTAMYRAELGNIDFVYGKKGQNGYGLAHIKELHSEIIPHIIEIIKKGEIINQAKDRVLLFYKVPKGKGVAVIRLDWNGLRKQWLVSAF